MGQRAMAVTMFVPPMTSSTIKSPRSRLPEVAWSSEIVSDLKSVRISLAEATDAGLRLKAHGLCSWEWFLSDVR